MRDLAELRIEKGRHPALKRADVDSLQRRLNLKLPPAYVALLLHSNGGHPQVDTFRTAAGEWAINNFFHIGAEDDVESVEWNFQRKWPGADGGVLPVARDGGGNLFALDLSRDPAPVLLWLHDASGKVLELASTFDDFLEGLQENPDYI